MVNNAEAQLNKNGDVNFESNPLLQVPPARLCAVPLAKRGEPQGGGKQVPTSCCRFPLHAYARFPSRSGGNLTEGGNRFRPPPAGSPCKQGEPNPRPTRFPSRSGGNLKEGGNKSRPPAAGSPCTPMHGSPREAGGTLRRGAKILNPLLQVPPASRGNRTRAPLGSPREAGGTLRRGE
jgi:hypothetical protein